jgi:hypothetical protein
MGQSPFSFSPLFFFEKRMYNQAPVYMPPGGYWPPAQMLVPQQWAAAYAPHSPQVAREDIRGPGSGFKITALVLLGFEAATTSAMLITHSLRQDLNLVPTIIFGLTWIHVIGIMVLAAAVSVSGDRYIAEGLNVIYGFIAIIDAISLALIATYPRSFSSSEYRVWTLSASIALLVVSVSIYIFSLIFWGDAVRKNNQKYREGIAKYGSEFNAKQQEWNSTKIGYFARFTISGLSRTAIITWLFFAGIAILRNMIQLRPTWFLLTSLPYLWAWPWLSAVTGPVADVPMDPEPYVRTPGHSAIIGSYVFLGVGILAVAVSTGGVFWHTAFTTSLVSILDFVCISLLLGMLVLNGILFGLVAPYDLLLKSETNKDHLD